MGKRNNRPRRHDAELAAQLNRMNNTLEQLAPKKRKWWLIIGAPVVAALMAGTLVVVTDFASIFGNAIKVNDQLGPKVEESVGPPAIIAISVARNSDTTGDVLLPDDPQARTRVLADPLRNGSSMQQWKDRNQLISVGQVTWEIGLQTLRTERIEITGMVPVLLDGKCGAPLKGAILKHGSSGGIDKIPLEIEIDSAAPVFMERGKDSTLAPYFKNKMIALEKGKDDAILLTATASKAHCKWNIRAEYYAAGSKQEQFIVDPQGNLVVFEITAAVPIEQYDVVVPDSLSCGGSQPQPMSGRDLAAGEPVVCK